MRTVLGAALATTLMAGPAAADTAKLLAAGSLRAALTEISEGFHEASGVLVESDFGASGLLRQRIMEGEEVDVFASANLEHPQGIAAERGGEVRPFARNKLCALTQPNLEVTTKTLLDVRLRDEVRVGTSTPVADPSGDYAFELFDKAEAQRPGAAITLKAKALQLTSSPDSPRPDMPRSVYGWVMEEGQADLFLTYCTNAIVAAAAVPSLRIVDISPDLNVGADYGLIVLTGSDPARSLAEFILSAEGQAILARHGFGAPR